MKIIIIMILFPISFTLHAQYDTISFNDIIINKKFLLHTSRDNFDYPKHKTMRIHTLEGIKNIANLPFVKEKGSFFIEEISKNICYYYIEENGKNIYIESVSADNQYKIYLKINKKIILLNNKKEVFFSNIFKESYKTFLFNRQIVNNKEFDIVIKKNKEFAFLRLIFNNGVFKGVLLIEKWRVK